MIDEITGIGNTKYFEANQRSDKIMHVKPLHKLKKAVSLKITVKAQFTHTRRGCIL